MTNSVRVLSTYTPRAKQRDRRDDAYYTHSELELSDLCFDLFLTRKMKDFVMEYGRL